MLRGWRSPDGVNPSLFTFVRKTRLARHLSWLEASAQANGRLVLLNYSMMFQGTMRCCMFAPAPRGMACQVYTRFCHLASPGLCVPLKNVPHYWAIPQVRGEIGWDSLIQGVPIHRWEFLSDIYYFWLEPNPKGSREQDVLTQVAKGQSSPATPGIKGLPFEGNCNMSPQLSRLDWLFLARQS